MRSSHSPTKAAYVEKAQGLVCTIFGIVFAFLLTPYLVGLLMEHAVAFAQHHYGLGWLMPFVLWPGIFAGIGVTAATALKVILTREILKFLMPPR